MPEGHYKWIMMNCAKALQIPWDAITDWGYVNVPCQHCGKAGGVSVKVDVTKTDKVLESMEERIAGNLRGHIRLMDLDGANIYNGKLTPHDLRMGFLRIVDELKNVEDEMEHKKDLAAAEAPEGPL
jgi:hypothetical protein